MSDLKIDYFKIKSRRPTPQMPTCSMIYSPRSGYLPPNTQSPDYVSPAFNCLNLPDITPKRKPITKNDPLPKALSGREALAWHERRSDQKRQEEETKQKKREEREKKERKKMRNYERKKKQKERSWKKKIRKPRRGNRERRKM